MASEHHWRSSIVASQASCLGESQAATHRGPSELFLVLLMPRAVPWTYTHQVPQTLRKALSFLSGCLPLLSQALLPPSSLCCQHSSQRLLLGPKSGSVTSLLKTSQWLDSLFHSGRHLESLWWPLSPFLMLQPLWTPACSSSTALRPPLQLWPPIRGL